MSQLLIGTSGYSYDDWRGPFYPDTLPKNRMLEFYARHFSCTEINASYYTIPAAQSFERMLRKVPAEFRFIVKAHQETTHIRKENESALSKLLEAVKPLQDAGQFEGILAQFPYSFKNNEPNRRYLARTRELTGEIPLFAEFRHASWVKGPLYAFLRDLGIGYVNVDEPGLEGLLPAQDVVTADSAYIRFHGRNRRDWWEGKGSARYDYEYRDDELREWLTHLSQILRKTFKTFIFFNNHPNGQAVKNAKQMIQILADVQKNLFK